MSPSGRERRSRGKYSCLLVYSRPSLEGVPLRLFQWSLWGLKMRTGDWIRWGNYFWLCALWYCFHCSVFSHARLFVTPWTVAHQAPPTMGFPRQEYWSGLPFPILPDPGIEPSSPKSGYHLYLLLIPLFVNSRGKKKPWEIWIPNQLLFPPTILFFYFWLCWAFLAVCRLSLAAVSGGYSLVSTGMADPTSSSGKPE